MINTEYRITIYFRLLIHGERQVSIFPQNTSKLQKTPPSVSLAVCVCVCVLGGGLGALCPLGCSVWATSCKKHYATAHAIVVLAEG